MRAAADPLEVESIPQQVVVNQYNANGGRIGQPRSPSPTMDMSSPLRRVTQRVIGCILLISFLVGSISNSLPLASAAQTSVFMENLGQDHIVLTGAKRHCLTECDCYKNSAVYGIDTMHLCFECAALRNSTCQVVAACPLGYVCTKDPAYSATTNDFFCQQPKDPVTEAECFVDSDCVRLFQDPETRQVYTFNGHCLPNSNCQYPQYGIIPGATIALELTLRPFNHLICAPQPYSLPCSTLGDCYHISTKNTSDVIYHPWAICSNETHQCSNGKGRENSGVVAPPQPKATVTNPLELTLRERLALRLNSTVNGNTNINATSSGNTLEGVECETDDQCQAMGRLRDPDGTSNCYSCLPSLKQQSLLNGGWNVTKVCVRTDSGCLSEMCHRGSCIGKPCKAHIDCLEIAGVTRHCHECDATAGICKARKLCDQGEACTTDIASTRECSNSVRECVVGYYSYGRGDFTCVPTGPDKTGYLRVTNYIDHLGRDLPRPISSTPSSPEFKERTYYHLMTQNRALSITKEERRRAAELEKVEKKKGKDNNGKNSQLSGKPNAIDWDSITLDEMPENNIKLLFSRSNTGVDRIVQYTPAQSRQRALSLLSPQADQTTSGNSNADDGDDDDDDEDQQLEVPASGVNQTSPSSSSSSSTQVQSSDEGDVLSEGGSGEEKRNKADEHNKRKKASASSPSTSTPSDAFAYYTNVAISLLVVAILLLAVAIFTCFVTAPTPAATYEKTPVAPPTVATTHSLPPPPIYSNPEHSQLNDPFNAPHSRWSNGRSFSSNNKTNYKL